MNQSPQSLIAKALRSAGLPKCPKIEDDIEHYFREMIHEGKKINLTAYRTLEDVIRYHLVDSLYIRRFIGDMEGKNLCDVGSGAGVPGIPIAITGRDMRVTLIDASRKKTFFIQRIVEKLSLNHCEPVWGRAEELGRDSRYRERYSIVTARALASLPITLELTAPFVQIGGELVLPRGEEDGSLGQSAMEELGLEPIESNKYRLEGRDRDFLLIRCRKIHPTPLQYPRNTAKMTRSPL